jgi:hypothetical protein
MTAGEIHERVLTGLPANDAESTPAHACDDDAACIADASNGPNSRDLLGGRV